jgi:hypothetical protein
MRWIACAVGALLALSAFAHVGERAYILLLPTGLYILGGALAVALSFVVMALVPSAFFSRMAHFRRPFWNIARANALGPSAAALALLALLLAAGYSASRDPLANPLPLTVWTLWWIGFTFLVALAGDLWAPLNPWRAAYRLAALLPGLERLRATPPLAYPERLGYWPAALLLFAFGWFELVYPAPQDPERLASAVIAYAGLTLAGMFLFGEDRWLERAEAFSVFFRMVGWLSPFSAGGGGGEANGRLALSVGLPCRGLLGAGALPASGVAFVLVALGNVSFDGLSRTFWWLGLIGENPLEYPGRTALMAMNTLGLAGTVAALAVLYLAAVRLGGQTDFGRYVVAIVPIAFGYHFAHYFPTFLVDVQYAAIALSDPFDEGWNLLGARDLQVTGSFLAHHSTVHAIWNLQAAAIVAAHVAAVFVAHVLALRRHGSVRRAIASLIPMTALMVAYTVFGLWLLSTPVAA